MILQTSSLFSLKNKNMVLKWIAQNYIKHFVFAMQDPMKFKQVFTDILEETFLWFGAMDESYGSVLIHQRN